MKLKNPGETKFVTIAPGIPMDENNNPIGLALMVLGDTGPTLAHPLHSPEAAAGFLLALTEAAAAVFGSEKFSEVMAEMTKDESASDASSDGLPN